MDGRCVRDRDIHGALFKVIGDPIHKRGRILSSRVTGHGLGCLTVSQEASG
jgi:hypothetical protein